MSQERSTSAQARYTQLKTIRESYLNRARRSAKVTIPALMPETEGDTYGEDLYTPFQSIGARGVNNLAAKLLLALLPPGDPFFRLTLDDFLLRELADKAKGAAGPDPRQKFEEGFNAIERAVMTRLEQIQLRPTAFETLKQLIVSGNALLQIRPSKGGVRMYRMDQYVVKRDSTGTPLEIVVFQKLSRAAAPEKVLSVLDDHQPEDPDGKSPEQNINLYTWIKRERNHWRIHQEANDRIVPGTEGTEPLDRSSWHALRFTRIDNEDWGRGHVEEYIGDLISLESLSQSLVEAAAAMAKVVPMVKEGGTTSRRKLAEADNLEVIYGDADDVSFLQVDKFADMQVPKAQVAELKRDLAAVFLLSSGLPREAERVTAEEIRLLAAELEDTLGGTYSLFSEEFQLPLVKKLMGDMQARNELPKLPKGKVVPQIVTGLEALGRNRDLQKLDTLVQGTSQILPPEEVALHIDTGAYIRRRGVALGIDLDGVVRTPEQVEAIRQQRAQQALAEKLGPEAMKQAGAQQQGSGQPAAQ